MKKLPKKLELAKETLLNLEVGSLENVYGRRNKDGLHGVLQHRLCPLLDLL